MWSCRRVARLDKHHRERYIARLRLEAATGAELVEIDLRRGDVAIGKALREIPLPPECVVASIQRGSRMVVPRGSTQLLSGDCVIALVAPDAAGELCRALREGASS